MTSITKVEIRLSCYVLDEDDISRWVDYQET